MVDVGALFGLGKGLAAQAIRTAGTEVTLTPPPTGAVNRDTLAATTTTAAGTSAKAILTAAGRTTTLPGLEVRATDWRLIMLPATEDPAPKTIVTVTRCRDARLVGATGKVLGSVRDSSGAVLVVYARPELL